MTINERIELIISERFMGNKRAFAKAVGVSASVVENIVGSRRSAPSFGVIEKICANAHISPEWLILGEGEMLNDPGDTPPAGPADEPTSLRRELEACCRRVDSLIAQNGKLLDIIGRLSDKHD